MKLITSAVFALFAFSSAAIAEGDVAKGQKSFGKCKACHSVVTPEGDVLFKGGRTGPNLYGVIGRPAASTDFRYSKDLIALGETGLVWSQEELAAFVADPRGYLKAKGTKGKTKMMVKLKKGGPDVAAFLASLAPAPEEVEAAAEDMQAAPKEEAAATSE
ncbi:MAG: c-type cytochrome [Cognatishimia sp.]